MKEIEEDTKSGRTWIEKSNVKLFMLSIEIYRFKCNPFQNTNGILCRTGQNIPKINTLTEKPLIMQCNPKQI